MLQIAVRSSTTTQWLQEETMSISCRFPPRGPRATSKETLIARRTNHMKSVSLNILHRAKPRALGFRSSSVCCMLTTVASHWPPHLGQRTGEHEGPRHRNTSITAYKFADRSTGETTTGGPYKEAQNYSHQINGRSAACTLCEETTNAVDIHVHGGPCM